jgi:AraC-like DNA-binding protein
MTDALTLSLSRISIQAMIAGRSILSAPWGFRVPIGNDGRPLMPPALNNGALPKLQAPGGCLYVLLSGECVFESDFGLVHLGAGDLLFMTVSATHQLRDSETSAAVPIWDIAPPPIFPIPHLPIRSAGPQGLHITGGGAETQLLQAILFFADGVKLQREQIPSLLLIRAMAAETPAWVPDILNVLVLESERGAEGSTSVASRMIQTLFDLAIMLDRERQANAEPRRDKRIEQALSLLQLHPDRSWTVAELAAQAGMSRTAFAALFATETGLSTLRYLAQCRIERACRMLRNGDDSIKRIALSVGYASEPAFYTAFKASEGVTPSVYRALHLNGPGGQRGPWVAAPSAC